MIYGSHCHKKTGVLVPSAKQSFYLYVYCVTFDQHLPLHHHFSHQ